MREADISAVRLKQPDQHDLVVRCIGNVIAFGTLFRFRFIWSATEDRTFRLAAPVITW